MKTIAYFRVSTDIQDNNRQISDVTTYCERNNLEIIQKFQESISGKKKNRKVIQQLFDYLSDNKDVKYLIVSELSRLGRTNEVLSIIDKLHSINVGLISLKENITTLDNKGNVNATTQMLIGILSSINSYELDTLKYRTKSGIKQRLVQGKGNSNGNNSYGYTTDEKGYIIPEINEATVIKQAVDLILKDNKSLLYIVDYFNQKKMYRRKGYKWTLTALRKNLQNPIIKGERTLKDGTVIPVEPIISENEFNKIQEIFDLRRYKKNTVDQTPASSLSGKLICSNCGLPIRKSLDKYKCTGSDVKSFYFQKTKTKCNTRSISINHLNEIVDFLILNFYSDSISSNFDVSKEKQKIAELNEKKELLVKSLKDISKQNERLLDLFLNEILGKNVYINKKNQLDSDSKKIQSKIQEINQSIINLESIIYNLVSVDKFKKKVQKEGTVGDELRRKIIDKIEIKRGEFEGAKVISDIVVYFNDLRSYPVTFDHFKKIGHVPLLPSNPTYINNAKIKFIEMMN